MKKYCVAIRLLAHTQPKLYRLREKKAHLMEVQINGGSISEKVNMAFIRLYCVKLLKWWLSSLFWMLVRISLDRNHYAWSRIKLNTRFQNLCPIAHKLAQVDFGRSLFEKPITVKDIFAMNENIDVIGVTRGHGFKGKFSSSLLLYWWTFYNSWNDDWAPSSDW